MTRMARFSPLGVGMAAIVGFAFAACKGELATAVRASTPARTVDSVPHDSVPHDSVPHDSVPHDTVPRDSSSIGACMAAVPIALWIQVSDSITMRPLADSAHGVFRSGVVVDTLLHADSMAL